MFKIRVRGWFVVEEEEFSAVGWGGFLFLFLLAVWAFVEEDVSLVLLEGVAYVMELSSCLFGLRMDRGKLGLLRVEGREWCYSGKFSLILGEWLKGAFFYVHVRVGASLSFHEELAAIILSL